MIGSMIVQGITQGLMNAKANSTKAVSSAGGKVTTTGIAATVAGEYAMQMQQMSFAEDLGKGLRDVFTGNVSSEADFVIGLTAMFVLFMVTQVAQNFLNDEKGV